MSPAISPGKKFPGRSDIRIYPLTAERWDDFEELFGKRGACGGCWCMYWRLRRKEFNQRKGAGNRLAMKNLVDRNSVPGILAYERSRAIGWCAIAPREEYPVLENSRILKRIDQEPVWSVVCFFIQKDYRGRGISTALLRAAVRYAAEHGGKILEGYPVEPRKKPAPAVFVYTGLASAFINAGFREAARRSPTRPIMRYYIDPIAVVEGEPLR